MRFMAARHRKEDQWKAAKKRGRLNDEEVPMAKELGIGPRSLIKNIPLILEHAFLANGLGRRY